MAGKTDPADTLLRSTTHGFLWLLLQAIGGRAGSLLSQLILARLLAPGAFGQIGLALTVTSVVTALINFGVDDILLQRQRMLRFWITPAFWTSLGLAVLGMGLMLAAAPCAAYFYHDRGLIGLVCLVAISLPIGALNTVPAARLRAAMRFKFLAGYAAAETLGIQLATVGLAVAGCGPYAFLIPLPVAALIKAVVFWRKLPIRIGGRWRPAQSRYLIRSGLTVQASRVVIELVSQGDYIVLGLLGSATTVGLYFFAFRLAVQPLRMLAGNVGAVIFPALTQLRDDAARQVQAALRASRMVAFTVTPACFLQAALAAPLLHLLFSDRWHGAVPLVELLSLGLPGDAVAWISGALLIARGQFRRDLNFLVMFAIPFFACVLVGARFGALGVAAGVAIYYAFIKPLASWLIFRPGIDAWGFLQIYGLPSLLSAIAIGAPRFVAMRMGGDIVRIVVILGLSPVLYGMLLRWAAPGVFQDMLARFGANALLHGLARRLPGFRPDFLAAAADRGRERTTPPGHSHSSRRLTARNTP